MSLANGWLDVGAMDIWMYVKYLCRWVYGYVDIRISNTAISVLPPSLYHRYISSYTFYIVDPVSYQVK